MKVNEIMTTSVKTCDQNSNLAEAAYIMWETDCGIVPIVDRENRVAGLLTDRDICMAVATKNRLASDIRAIDVITGNVISCTSNDDVSVALELMQNNKVRRIPIVDRDNYLSGILSLSDIVSKSTKKDSSGKSIAYESTIETFKAVTSPNPAA